MKDLYSIHASEEDLNQYYEKVKAAYSKIFDSLGIPTVITLASGGIFTPNFSHEFQSSCSIGEDTVYVCPENDYAVNKEVLAKTGEECPTHHQKLVPHRAVEVGNIFNLGTTFSESMKVGYRDQDDQEKPFWFASYGIGLGRAMGVAVEQHHDEAGIIWPETIAPYKVHLIDLTKTDEEQKRANNIYQTLVDAEIEVLFDDRAEPAGVKFTDADLLGIPYRLVVSSKTLSSDNIEVKKREGDELKMVPVDNIVDFLKQG